MITFDTCHLSTRSVDASGQIGNKISGLQFFHEIPCAGILFPSFSIFFCGRRALAFPAMLGGACPAPANVHCAWETVQCAGLAWEGHSSVTSLGAGGAHRSPQSLRHNHDDHLDDDYSITMIICRRTPWTKSSFRLQFFSLSSHNPPIPLPVASDHNDVFQH